jgi:hypothetical protein
VAGVEAPPDARRRHPLGDAGQVVVVETEAPADRVAAGEVDDLGGGHPAVGQGEEVPHRAEHRVRLP